MSLVSGMGVFFFVLMSVAPHEQLKSLEKTGSTDTFSVFRVVTLSSRQGRSVGATRFNRTVSQVDWGDEPICLD
ncbi:hypothetical protein HG15A2_46710 [Adhaeretor mobilis]|uniref:Uncharacterized protein n=1 Tax=Adhaeretor mobilis TaxID=1930276 RepID=A0A517N2G2_9BACT|nr:hypothetical protein HG15A2_46710 [Adhaeretor mobilis]